MQRHSIISPPPVTWLGGTSASSPTPTRPKITFPSNLAGLNPSNVGGQNANPGVASMATLAANTDSAAATLGTLAIDIDGFYVKWEAPGARSYRLTVNDGGADIISNHGFRTAGSVLQDDWLPIRILAGKTLTLKLACETANPGDLPFRLYPYKLDTPEVVTRIIGMGNSTPISTLGAGTAFNGTTPNPVAPQMLVADTGAALTKALKFHAGASADNLRTNCKFFMQLFSGASGSEVAMQLPILEGYASSNLVLFSNQGPFWQDVAPHSRLAYQAWTDNAAATDSVNLQAILLQ